MHLEISSFKRIVVLTGAGISAESGISTFRDSNGLWENYRIEDVATPEAFARDPRLVWRFYSMRRMAAARAKPNEAHLALARFTSECLKRGIEFTLVTQNVDGLHERALNTIAATTNALFAMHGTLSQSRCVGCGEIYVDPFAWFTESGDPAMITVSSFASLSTDVSAISQTSVKRGDCDIPLSPCCHVRLRPHIVWFGEMPLYMDSIFGTVSTCDLFVTVGTSGLVYPAAGLIEQAKIAGATTACLNREPIPQQSVVDFYIEGPATQTVPALFPSGDA